MKFKSNFKKLMAMVLSFAMILSLFTGVFSTTVLAADTTEYTTYYAGGSYSAADNNTGPLGTGTESDAFSSIYAAVTGPNKITNYPAKIVLKSSVYLNFQWASKATTAFGDGKPSGKLRITSNNPGSIKLVVDTQNGNGSNSDPNANHIVGFNNSEIVLDNIIFKADFVDTVLNNVKMRVGENVTLDTTAKQFDVVTPDMSIMSSTWKNLNATWGATVEGDSNIIVGGTANVGTLKVVKTTGKVTGNSIVKIVGNPTITTLNGSKDNVTGDSILDLTEYTGDKDNLPAGWDTSSFDDIIKDTTTKYTVTINQTSDGTLTYNEEFDATITLPTTTSAATPTEKRFAGWTDGSNIYAPGAVYTVVGNATLEPAFVSIYNYEYYVGAQPNHSDNWDDNHPCGDGTYGSPYSSIYAAVNLGLKDKADAYPAKLTLKGSVYLNAQGTSRAETAFGYNVKADSLYITSEDTNNRKKIVINKGVEGAVQFYDSEIILNNIILKSQTHISHLTGVKLRVGENVSLDTAAADCSQINVVTPDASLLSSTWNKVSATWNGIVNGNSNIVIGNNATVSDLTVVNGSGNVSKNSIVKLIGSPTITTLNGSKDKVTGKSVLDLTEYTGSAISDAVKATFDSVITTNETYTVTVNGTAKQYSLGDEITLPDALADNDNQYFTGWTDGITEYAPSSTYMVVGDATISADYGSYITVTAGNETFTKKKAGDKITLPATTSNTPEGKFLAAWKNETKLYAPGDDYTVAGNATLTAVFADSPKGITTAPDYMIKGTSTNWWHFGIPVTVDAGKTYVFNYVSTAAVQVDVRKAVDSSETLSYVCSYDAATKSGTMVFSAAANEKVYIDINAYWGTGVYLTDLVCYDIENPNTNLFADITDTKLGGFEICWVEPAENGAAEYDGSSNPNTNDIKLVWSDFEQSAFGIKGIGPEIVSAENGTVTLEAKSGYAYSKDGGKTSQESNVFTDLEEDVVYSFCYVSENILLADAGITKFGFPSAPVVTLRGDKTLVVEETEGFEYSADGINWYTIGEISGLVPNTSYTILKRVSGGYDLRSQTAAVTDGLDKLPEGEAVAFIYMRKQLFDFGVSLAVDYNGDGMANILDLVVFKNDQLAADKTVTVAAWGDSITQGMNMEAGQDYPAQLQSTLGEGYTVLNGGDPGEDSFAIAARQGAYDIFTWKDLTFDAGVDTIDIGDDLSDFYFGSEDGTRNFKLLGSFGNAISINPITINGVEYTIGHKEGYSWDNSKADVFTLTRTDTSSAVTIKKGTKVELSGTNTTKTADFNIYYAGANNQSPYNSADALIADIQAMIDYQGNRNYIVVMPTYTSGYDAAFIKAFGSHAVNVREQAITDGLNFCGITATAADTANINAGKIPVSLMLTDGQYEVHLNANGYKFMAHVIHEKGIELGFWAADENELKVVAWGDSITMGQGAGVGQSYVAQLQGVFEQNDIAATVYNAGHSGEKSLAIAARQGAYEVTLQNTVSFEAGQASVSLGMAQGLIANNENVIFTGTKMGTDTNTIDTNPIIINGVAYTLGVRYADDNDYEYTITRADTSSALTLNAGTVVTLSSAINGSDSDFEIYFVGANDGIGSAETAIAHIQAMIANKGEGFENYIVIVPNVYKNNENNQYQLFVDTFGADKVIDEQGELASDAAFEWAGISKSDIGSSGHGAYENEIGFGWIPTCFQTGDHFHLNALGYKYLAKVLFDRGVTLGYWSAEGNS